MAAEQSWVIAERAESLAILYLTRRKDLMVIPASRYNRSVGYDLLVQIREMDGTEDRTFAIEAKGARAASRIADDMFMVRYTDSEIKGHGLPVCVFLFTVDDEKGYYRWLHPPLISEHGSPELRLDSNLSVRRLEQHGDIQVRSRFEPLDSRSLALIIEQVSHWYSIKEKYRIEEGR